jgi:hypothetical protein
MIAVNIRGLSDVSRLAFPPLRDTPGATGRARRMRGAA